VKNESLSSWALILPFDICSRRLLGLLPVCICMYCQRLRTFHDRTWLVFRYCIFWKRSWNSKILTRNQCIGQRNLYLTWAHMRSAKFADVKRFCMSLLFLPCRQLYFNNYSTFSRLAFFRTQTVFICQSNLWLKFISHAVITRLVP